MSDVPQSVSTTCLYGLTYSVDVSKCVRATTLLSGTFQAPPHTLRVTHASGRRAGTSCGLAN